MLRGEVTALRAIEREDLTQLLEWRNRPEYRRYFREYRELSLEHQRYWFEQVVMGDHRTRMFAITGLLEGRLLGACGLCAIDWRNRNADFSIYIGADGLYIDDHFALDAARLLMRYAFEELNLHRLWAEIYDFDAPKKRLFALLGFTEEGRFREHHWGEGGWHDSIFYGRLNSD